MSLSTFLLCVLQVGKTALHYCAVHGHASVAEVLTGAGANVNAVDYVSWCVMN